MFPLMTTVATRYAPVVTWSLILFNTLVFLWQTSLPPAALELFIRHYALIPARFFYPGWAALHGADSGLYLPFVTNIFLHGGWLHLIMNMWMLYIFGPAVEDRLGSGRFVLFYLLCGIGASAAHAYVNAASTLPALGASGAIAGIMGAYMRLFPFSRLLVVVPVFIFPFFFEMFAAYFVGFWFILQLVQGLWGLFASTAQLGGGIAWWAHIGGFAVGWLLISPLRHNSRMYRPFQRDEGVHGFLPNGQRTGKGPWL